MNLASVPHAVVLETNVLMTASEHAPQASDECVRQCVGVIEQVKQGEHLPSLWTTVGLSSTSIRNA
jgi:hypothetical protein